MALQLALWSATMALVFTLYCSAKLIKIIDLLAVEMYIWVMRILCSRRGSHATSDAQLHVGEELSPIVDLSVAAG